MAYPTRPLEPKFWVKVRKTGPDDCWEWQAHRDKDGYGRIRHDGQDLRAHRVSYEMAHGVTLTPDQLVLHSCDNPPCVNPKHLSVGDTRRNALEAIERGKSPYAPNGKLTFELAAAIRKEYAQGERQVVLAARYGVSQVTISLVVRGIVW